ncbi:hypothetical protein Scep_028204 [Stephania cephalantha]|uniref:Uncharacterized protein n=1 Tax=Stephania cephalantha TaxID=152367 RepID=A0AAP0ECP1_9MAGN
MQAVIHMRNPCSSSRPESSRDARHCKDRMKNSRFPCTLSFLIHDSCRATV